MRLVTSENTRRTPRHDTLIYEILRVLDEGPQGFPWGHLRDVAGTKTDATEPPWDPHGDPGGSQASHRGRKTAASSAQRAPKVHRAQGSKRDTPSSYLCTHFSSISTRRRVQRDQGTGGPNGARAQVATQEHGTLCPEIEAKENTNCNKYIFYV